MSESNESSTLCQSPMYVTNYFHDLYVAGMVRSWRKVFLLFNIFYLPLFLKHLKWSQVISKG